jgi:arsenite-transporting ATPase
MLSFIEAPTRLLFFTGKGGVGKTSLACATAVALADAGRRVLLVSTDPASNLGQVFGADVTPEIAPVAGVERLWAVNVDPQAAAASYRDRVLAPVRGALPEAALAQITEQLSGACTVEIAAFDEFTRLLVDPERTDGFDHVVFDTAPTGHTLRLLQLPAAWSGFIEANPDGASCLGPFSGLEAQRAQYAEVVEALGDPARTTLVLVARPDRASLAEAARTSAELDALGVRSQRLVVNGTFAASDPTDALAVAMERRQREALGDLPTDLADLPTERVALRPHNLVGLDALRSLVEDGAGTMPEVASAATVHDDLGDAYPSLSELVDEVERDGHGLVMVMGKGGVGKTTVAAAVAAELAARGHAVHLSTTDPAAHVEAVAGEIEHLTVSRIDPRAETERYVRHVVQTKGKGLDADGLRLLEEDLRSPCTEEVAVFHAFSRVVREAARGFVVLDTAPTGHTLLLLDQTGAYHREVLRNTHLGPGRVTTPLMRLQDPAYTKLLVVTLPETTPVLEAAALQADLSRAGIEPFAWVVNQSLAAARPTDPLLVARAEAERPLIEAVRREHARRVVVLPMTTYEPVGADPLIALVRGAPILDTADTGV